MYFDKAMALECAVERAERSQVNDMIQKHYLKRWPGVVVGTYVMKHRGIAVGMIVYALPPSQVYKRYGGLTWELARLWIDDVMPRNAETWLIAQTINKIARERPEVRYLISYADPSAGHKGVIYRASNWTPDGRTDDDRKTPRFDYESNGKHYSRQGHIPPGAQYTRKLRISKYRFVYPMPKPKRRVSPLGPPQTNHNNNEDDNIDELVLAIISAKNKSVPTRLEIVDSLFS